MVKIMEISRDMRAAVQPALWGAAGGAIALALIGFSLGGWVTGGTAESLARSRVESAVVAALSPFCVDTFRRAADAPANLAEMQRMSSGSYASEQGKFIEKGGWATAPGSTEPNSAVARACADALGSENVAELRR
jgi:hypothetical protein